ncbi:MAG: phosphoenolpyruvate carboxylase [Alphaproteobacteria bacterium]
MSEDTLQPLSNNIRLLGGILGETIAQFEGKRIFNKVEKLRRHAQKARLGSTTAHKDIERELQTLSHNEKYKVAKAFTEFLRLANLCEQVHRIRRRKEYQRTGSTPQRASPLDTFSRLLKAGISRKAITQALLEVQIELVLTAHPTEALMPQAIRAYRDLSTCLLKLDSAEPTKFERTLIVRDMRSIVIQLWLSGVVRDKKPTPVDEARYGLELAERILWRAVPDFHYLMSAAYKEVVGDMSELYPRPIRFASWMGGDRDGHPGVTAHVTRRVLNETSHAATARYLEAIKLLRHLFVFDRDARGIRLQKTCQKYLDTMETKLKEFRRGLPKGKTSFTRMEFLALLYELQKFLKDNDVEMLALGPLQEFIWRVRVFGLCFLKLDIRQSADVHEDAIDEIMGGRYAKLNEQQRIRALLKGIRKPPRPRRLSRQSAEVLKTLRLYQEVPLEFLGPYIISMAAKVSDMLGVLFLFKAAGVDARVRICPLFETPESLESACKVMDQLYRIPLYYRHAGAQQHIMVGYSDSAKRGGYLNSAWEIYGLQKDLLALGKKHRVNTIFFHGRGGSVARGGGPIETALLALPRPLDARTIRVTEQGEAINSKFGLPEMAERTMELYLSGFMEAVLSKPQKKPAAWTAAMDRLAHRSKSAFRAVVYGEAQFMNHYMQLTPTAELGLLKIGSRPGRRKKDGGLESLRAIPWVFGWTQSRTLLPAWLGIAEALDSEIKAGNLKVLQDMYKRWPFFQSVIDLVEMVVAKADEQVTEYYSALLVEPSLQWLTQDYLERLGKTKKALLLVMKRKKMLETSPVLSRSIRIRSPYVDVLNILQAHLLKEYRALSRPPADLRKTLALTIGGISAGMRNTG